MYPYDASIQKEDKWDKNQAKHGKNLHFITIFKNYPYIRSRLEKKQ